jgi:pimeloyl-ACP methyl ester carboxylesterase
MTPVSDHPQQQNSPDQSAAGRPTIVLVHGAFADSSSWVAVDRALAAEGYTAVPVANPLRGLDGDAAYTASVAATIDGPVVLVGHSYAGAVITQAATALENVVGLVYVAPFIPEIGETANDLNARFLGSLLVPENLIVRPTADGKTDLYIRPERSATLWAVHPLRPSSRQPSRNGRSPSRRWGARCARRRPGRCRWCRSPLRMTMPFQRSFSTSWPSVPGPTSSKRIVGMECRCCGPRSRWERSSSWRVRP